MQKERKSGIYCIENIITNKKYIGQSIDVNERWRKHISELNHNYHHNDYLQKAWNKYGEKGFKFYCKLFTSMNIDSTAPLGKVIPKVDWSRPWTVEEILADYNYTEEEIKEVMNDLVNFKYMED